MRTGAWRGLSALMVLLAGGTAQGADPCQADRRGAPISIQPLLISANLPASDPTHDYRHRLQTTPMGWPLQSVWCVWVEPLEMSSSDATARRWQQAVTGALEEWEGVLALQQVEDPQRAQVRIRRQRPPLGQDPSGRPRASHGRATLTLMGLGAGPAGNVEPQVDVLISPGQRLEAIQATALHELGHAFGLWGHSDHPGDAMAVAPGATPILKLSPRDRATVQWLYRQATPMRSGP